MPYVVRSGFRLHGCATVLFQFDAYLITLLIKLSVTFMVSERSFLRFVDLDVRLAFPVSFECS